MLEEQEEGRWELKNLHPLVLCIQLHFSLCDRTAGCLPPLTGAGTQPHRTAHNRDTSPANLSRSFDISDSAVKESDFHVLPCIAQLL